MHESLELYASTLAGLADSRMATCLVLTSADRLRSQLAANAAAVLERVGSLLGTPVLAVDGQPATADASVDTLHSAVIRAIQSGYSARGICQHTFIVDAMGTESTCATTLNEIVMLTLTTFAKNGHLSLCTQRVAGTGTDDVAREKAAQLRAL